MRYKVTDINLSYQKDRNCASLITNTLNGEYYPSVTTYYFPDNTDLVNNIRAEINSAIHFIISVITFVVKAIAFKTSVILFNISFTKNISSFIKDKISVIEVNSSAKAFATSVIQFTANALAYIIPSLTSNYSVLPCTVKDASFGLKNVAFIVSSNQIDLRLKGSYHFSDWFRKKVL